MSDVAKIFILSVLIGGLLPSAVLTTEKPLAAAEVMHLVGSMPGLYANTKAYEDGRLLSVTSDDKWRVTKVSDKLCIIESKGGYQTIELLNTQRLRMIEVRQGPDSIWHSALTPTTNGFTLSQRLYLTQRYPDAKVRAEYQFDPKLGQLTVIAETQTAAELKLVFELQKP